MAFAASYGDDTEPFSSMLQYADTPEIKMGGVKYFEAETDRTRYFVREGPRSFRPLGREDLRKFPCKEDRCAPLAKKLKPGEVFWSETYVVPGYEDRMVTVVSPIYRHKEPIGVASVDLHLSFKQKRGIARLLASENYFAIYDRVGNLIIGSDNVKGHDIRRLSPNMPRSNGSAGTDPLPAPNGSNGGSRVDQESTGTGAIQTFQIVHDDPIFGEDAVVAKIHFPRIDWIMVVGIPEHILLADFNEVYRKVTFSTLFFILLFLLAGYLFIHRTFIRPLSSITEQIEKAGSRSDVVIETDDRGEIGTLVKRFNERNEALAKVKAHDEMSQKLLMQQSKMAAMGEMLDAVAHQWKQPLNALSLYNDLLVGDFREGKVDEAYMDRFRKDIQTQIDHMTDTLATFRSFFRPDTKQGAFSLKKVIDDVLFLAKDDLLKHGISVMVEGEDFTLYGSQNEFKHLLLNLLTNARDAFVENEAAERLVTIRLVHDPEDPRLEFEDTAGGIPPEHLDDVFKAHFTTKSEGKGTGIGLYMSLQIAHKHHAEMGVENRDKGACFIIRFSPASFATLPEGEIEPLS
jgi:signal transduction histidine kinase